MGRLLIVTIIYLAMVTFSIAANIIPLNGHTTSEISNSYTVLFSPAGYVNIIRVFIYIILTYWIYLLWKNRRTEYHITFMQTVYFVTSSVLNILWIYLWHYEYFTWSVIIIILMLLSLIGLYFTYPVWNRSWVGRLPISIYLAWESIVTFMNIAFLFTHNHWSFLDLSEPLWAVIMLTFGAAIALHVRFHYEDILFPIIYIWTFIGIAFKNGFEELLVTTAALFLSGVLVVGIIFIKKQKPSE
ncbi:MULTISPECIES: tryptophan-rich sensory protein [unclassified Rummeliibacillus]|uniref:tryptophan-rich sensory protein n=1 Tax=unclassified Rummeliibacillus TaxID=2622809 RepID=UPI001F232550|nr:MULTISPECIES: tryptophan-rich sensory protein [unclassified Rummeliibacillus]